jgi:hypothetical protein
MATTTPPIATTIPAVSGQDHHETQATPVESCSLEAATAEVHALEPASETIPTVDPTQTESGKPAVTETPTPVSDTTPSTDKSSEQAPVDKPLEAAPSELTPVAREDDLPDQPLALIKELEKPSETGRKPDPAARSESAS